MPQLCSVICLAFNHERFADAALTSIYEQAWADTEIIVLDDGSTDGTVEVVREKLKESPFRTTLLTQPNTGNVPRNFNRALGCATGTAVSFLSLDDMLLPGCIDRRMRVLEEDKQVVFAADAGYQEINELGDVVVAGELTPVVAYKVQTSSDLLEAEYQTLGSFYLQGQVFRRDTIEAVGGFEESMTGDDIVLRTKIFRHLVEHPDLRFHLGRETVFAYRKHSCNLHKKFLRQFKTIVEWKQQFFPERPYPKIFYSWLENFFREVAAGNASEEELAATLALDSVIADYYRLCRMRPRNRRRALRQRIARVFGFGGARMERR